MTTHTFTRDDSLARYRDEVARYPLLGRAEEIRLATRARAGDEAARRRLVESNLRLVVVIARRYRGQGLDLMDLVQEGNLGLMTAAERYDRPHELRFSSFAGWWIRREICRALSTTSRAIRLPRRLIEQMAAVRRVEEELMQRLGRPSSVAELAAEAGVDEDVVEELRRAERRPVSLSEPAGASDETELGELILDESAPDPAAGVAEADERAGVTGAVRALGERPRRVLEMRYGIDGDDPRTLEGVAGELGLSRERVRTIEAAALRALSAGRSSTSAKPRDTGATMTAATAHYDLVAIGSGPAGQRAAIQAAKLGRRAAVVEREPVLGGVLTNTGTLPSKTLRAAVVELTGQAHGVYANAYRVKDEITIGDLLWRTKQVIEHEREVIHDQLRRNRVDILTGAASFVDPHTLAIDGGDAVHPVHADAVVIAVGTTPARPAGVDFDDRTVLDSDGIQHQSHIPRTLTVVGGGVIGLDTPRSLPRWASRSRSSSSARASSTSSTRRSPRPCNTTCAAWGSSSVSARRSPGGAARGGRGHHPSAQRQDDPVRDRALRRRAPGRDGWPRPPRRRARGRRARPHRRRPPPPHRPAAHLRRRRRDRLPRLSATSMEQGRLAALRPSTSRPRGDARAVPVRDLHDPRDLVRRPRRAPADRRRVPTSWASAATASSPAGNPRRPLRDAEAARPRRDAHDPRRPRLRHRRDRARPRRPDRHGGRADARLPRRRCLQRPDLRRRLQGRRARRATTASTRSAAAAARPARHEQGATR